MDEPFKNGRCRLKKYIVENLKYFYACFSAQRFFRIEYNRALTNWQ